MKKMDSNGLKWLKIVHIVVLILMFGGIISSTIMRISLPLTNFEHVYAAYTMMMNISDYVVRYGAQGLLLTGIVYGVWTNWGFFRYRWVTVKWAIFMAQTIFGIVFVDRWMVHNMSLLEAERAMALTDPVFVQNHSMIKAGAMGQSGLLLFLIWVSVFKPWKKKALN
jgi:hypothetical protein